MPTLADLLAVNVFELDDWNYEGEEEEDSSAVTKATITKVSYNGHFTIVTTGLLHNMYLLANVLPMWIWALHTIQVFSFKDLQLNMRLMYNSEIGNRTFILLH